MLYHSKGKKTGMQYEAFLKVLPAVSRLLSRCETAQKQLKCLLKHLIMVYDSKVAKHIKNRYVEFPKELKKDTIEYVQKLGQNLFTIYKVTQKICRFTSRKKSAISLQIQKTLLMTASNASSYFLRSSKSFPKLPPLAVSTSSSWKSSQLRMINSR